MSRIICCAPLLLLALSACSPTTGAEGEGESAEGEGDTAEGEGEEGEGEEGEGEEGEGEEGEGEEGEGEVDQGSCDDAPLGSLELTAGFVVTSSARAPAAPGYATLAFDGDQLTRFDLVSGTLENWGQWPNLSADNAPRALIDDVTDLQLIGAAIDNTNLYVGTASYLDFRGVA
jgi:hypothetical protein